MENKGIHLRREGAVAVIELDRPARYNALDKNTIRELFEVVIEIRADESFRAVMLTATGDMFCTGADIQWMIDNRDDFSRSVDETIADLHSALSRLTRMSIPFITAVNGVAAGGGLALALAGDMVLAREDARFVSAYTRIGINPDGGSTFYLSRVLGLRRALDMVLTNRELNAEEALKWGLVNRILPKENFQEAALAVAQELAAGPTQAFGRSRDLIYHSWNYGLEAQLERETRHMVASAGTEDMRNATRAFVDKRPPVFTGR